MLATSIVCGVNGLSDAQRSAAAQIGIAALILVHQTQKFLEIDVVGALLLNRIVVGEVVLRSVEVAKIISKRHSAVCAVLHESCQLCLLSY